MSAGFPDRRARGRYRRLGLATVLGLRPAGLFIPYRHADTLAPPDAPYPAAAAAFDAARTIFRGVLADIDAVAGDLLAIGGPPPAPRWDQDWFAGLDAAAAYALVRARRPALIVEVGSGHSTRFMARAVADGRLATRIVAIDPAPRATLDGLAVDFRRGTLQDADPAVFAALRAGDVLFVDSSHVLAPGSDVDILLNRIVPALPAGVLVHVHDVFLPDPYPPEWAWRGYAEQLLLVPWLAGGGMAPLFASRYVRTRMTADVAASAAGRLPGGALAYESSLWLVRR